MFTTKITEASLREERSALEQLQKKRDELLEAVQIKRGHHSDQASLVARMTSAEGICESSDQEIAREEARLTETNRDFMRADGALRKFTTGDGKNLDARFNELTEREKEFQFGAARKALRTALSGHLQRLRELAAAEVAFEGMAKAAGYQRGPIRILASTRGEKTALDSWKRDILGFSIDLLPADDPQRRIYENERRLYSAA